ncbi:MAG: T9SS type A sorting domain-containing protein [Paludibacter sp.]|nr:T9SS type A sorting domain-containing protein [Paludibacter sp.]
MKHLSLTGLLLLSSIILLSQSLPSPSIRYASRYSSSSLFGLHGSLSFTGAISSASSDIINGYPAVCIDSAGGYFSFTSNVLSGKSKALFMIVYQPQAHNYLREIGLWSLSNGSGNRSLTSFYSVEGQRRIKYNYLPSAEVCVTTNYIHFKEIVPSNDAVASAVDTFYIGKCDSLLFSGKIAEFLLIDTAFTDVERHIWQSYLSLKYGAVIYHGDYVNSKGDTLWHYLKNQDFAQGVGGIGRDDLLSLRQNFSRIYGDSVKIALHNYIANERQIAQTPFSNGEYILWGHNDSPCELGYDVYSSGNDFYSFYQRQWKVQPHLQSGQTLDIKLNAINSPQNNIAALKLFVSEDAGFNPLWTRIYTPGIVENGNVTFSNILMPSSADGAFYFTFGYNTNDLNSQGFGYDFGQNSNGNTSNASQNPASSVFTEASYLPNPVTDNLYINYTLTRDATIWFSVHNNAGIPMCQTAAEQRNTGLNQSIIPMSHFMTGTYTVYIHVDDMTLMQTVIKK